MSDQPEFPLSFGAQLRARRIEAGWSLTRFAREVNYSSGHLSKLENGVKPPNEAFVRRCDVLFDAGGALVAAHRAEPAHRGQTTEEPGREDPMYPLAELGVTVGSGAPRWVDPGTVMSYRMSFDLLRARGQFLQPSDLLPTLITETRALVSLAAGGDSMVAADLLRLAARFAEYAGWMAQEAGDDEQARDLTEAAAGLAARAGDDMRAYRLVRLADLALYAGDAAATIDLSARALDSGADARVRGFAAQRLAHGHAMANQRDACLRALDLAAEFLPAEADGAPTYPAHPVVGSINVVDHVAMATGWCLLDLGEPEQAAGILAAEVARLPTGAHRARARYTVRLARCYAEIGEVDLACASAEPVLRRLVSLQSATTGTDVARLAGTLRRFRVRPSVRSLQPLLAETSHRRTAVRATA
jgi:transcriptional regulator with XRE-family HTH domain